MQEYSIHLPSKPKVVSEEGASGMYQIDGLYPGYGYTLGNSLRRIILSSIPGAAITSVRIDGVSHEFSTFDGVKEDVIGILLNLKKIRIRLNVDEPQTLTLKTKGPKDVKASDIEASGQVEVLNPDQHVATVTDNAELAMEMTVERGLGYVSRDVLQKNTVDVGQIALDAIFTPVRRVNYEVENMRVGDRTDFNRLKIFIETDGTVTPREVLERSIVIMIKQLKEIVDFQEEVEEKPEEMVLEESADMVSELKIEQEEERKEFLKTRIESLDLSTRTENALSESGIRTVGGLVRKTDTDLLALEGLGEKGLQEIKRVLGNHGIILRQD